METHLNISDRTLQRILTTAGAFVAANLIYWPALLLVDVIR